MHVKEFARRLRGQSCETDRAAVGQWIRGRGPAPSRVRRGWLRKVRKLFEQAARALTPSAGWTRRQLIEFCQQPGARLNRDAAVLCGVTVLGLSSRNRRRYTPEAVAGALSLYEGARVNLDHASCADEPRSVRDRFGRMENVRFADGRIKADLCYNPNHPFAPTLEWFARHDPGALGLSHNAVGEGRTEEGIFVVHKIVSLRSVDLVAEPATTRGLFEAKK
jgi:hypothetical protein